MPVSPPKRFGWDALGRVSALRSLRDKTGISVVSNSVLVGDEEEGKFGGIGKGRGSSLVFKLLLYL